MRYYQVIQPYQFNVYWDSATTVKLTAQFLVPMVNSPVLNLTNIVTSNFCGATAASSSTRLLSSVAPVYRDSTSTSIYLSQSGYTGGSGGSSGFIANTSTTVFGVSADY